jgi:hypothetical protein
LGLKKVSGDNPAVPILHFLGPLEETHFKNFFSILLLAMGEPDLLFLSFFSDLDENMLV